MKEKMKTRIKKDDTVKVLTGKEKGKTGRVLKIDRVSGRVIVQGLNMVKRPLRKRVSRIRVELLKLKHHYIFPMLQ